MIILLTKIYLATWFITNFEPLQNKIIDIISILKIKKINKHLHRLIELFYDVISCHKCLSLWTTLIITQSIWLAIGMSFIVYTIKNLTN